MTASKVKPKAERASRANGASSPATKATHDAKVSTKVTGAQIREMELPVLRRRWPVGRNTVARTASQATPQDLVWLCVSVGRRSKVVRP